MKDFVRDTDPYQDQAAWRLSELPDWAPPEAPLEMPAQVIEQPARRQAWLRLPAFLAARDA